MDLEQIKQILDLVREHELSEFEIEHDGLRLKVRKEVNGSHVVTLPAPAAPLVLPATVGGSPPAAAATLGETSGRRSGSRARRSSNRRAPF